MKSLPTCCPVANAIADLSVLTSFSLIARERNYTRPYVDDSDALFIEAGRHPVLEQKLGLGQFVDNDISFYKRTGSAFGYLLNSSTVGTVINAVTLEQNLFSQNALNFSGLITNSIPFTINRNNLYS